MFCYQCELSPGRDGCTEKCKCGKNKDTALLQDLLVNLCKDISRYAVYANKHRKPTMIADKFVTKAMTATLNNVNFDSGEIWALIQQAYIKKGELKELLRKSYNDDIATPSSLRDALEYAEEITIPKLAEEKGKVINDLQEFLIYSVKGICAFAYRARKLGKINMEVFEFIHRALAYTREDKEEVIAKKLINLSLESGKIAIKAMETLDNATEENFGEPTTVKVKNFKAPGKAILVSGNNLRILLDILEQTKDKDINVYTHGELLSGHSYPKISQHPHLVGHYGTGTAKQQDEFAEFPGAIVVTGNVLKEPNAKYRNRLFTTGLTRWPGVEHITGRDFSLTIAKALESKEFPAIEAKGEQTPEDAIKEAREKSKTYYIGFAHKRLLSIADIIIKMLQKEHIKRFLLIGGGDGNENRGSYPYELAKKSDKDWMILTFGNVKFRFLNLDLGNITGFPRIVDMGQEADFYSVVKVAMTLSKAMGTSINELPTSVVLSWFDPKSICTLMALLHMGIKNVRLTPNVPPFISKEVWTLFEKQYGLKLGKRADDDLLHMNNE
jgi:hydroxylamine reductase